jgi:hypothetical protein
MCKKESSHFLSQSSSQLEYMNHLLQAIHYDHYHVLNPFEGGRLTMKSMDTLSQGLSRIRGVYNNLACFLKIVQFCWHVKQVLTYSFGIIHQVEPIIILFEECCDALCITISHK